MFHVLLALPVLAVFGAAAAMVLAAMLTLWGAAFGAELLLGLFCRKRRWLLWLPVLFGVLGFFLMLLARIYPLELPFLIVLWGGYGVCLLAGWGMSAVLRRLYRWIRR